MHQERDASWSRLRSEPWRPRGHRRAHGSGLPRVQIVSLPAFGSPSFWEICQRGDDWLLYTAKVVNRDWHDLTVLGYEPVEFESDRLRAYFDGFVATSLPIGPDRSGMGGCDGAVTQLTLYGDLWSEVRFQWWSHSPPAWASVVDLTAEVLDAFEKKL